MIGLELGISIASCALCKEQPTTHRGFRSDVVATAKKRLKSGEMPDGEGSLAAGRADAGRSLAA